MVSRRRTLADILGCELTSPGPSVSGWHLCEELEVISEFLNLHTHRHTHTHTHTLRSPTPARVAQPQHHFLSPTEVLRPEAEVAPGPPSDQREKLVAGVPF